MSDTSQTQPAKKTTEEKIRIAIAFLQRHGYQVVSRHSIKHNKFISSDVERRMKKERESQLVDLQNVALQTAATIGTPELATILNVSQQTILNWLKADKLPPPLDLPGQHRWNVETIKQFLLTREKATSSPSSSNS